MPKVVTYQNVTLEKLEVLFTADGYEVVVDFRVSGEGARPYSSSRTLTLTDTQKVAVQQLVDSALTAAKTEIEE